MVVVIRGVVRVAMTLVTTLVMINDIMQCTLSVQSYFKVINLVTFLSTRSCT